MKQFITCALLFIVLTQVCLGSNLLVNGDFKDTPLNVRWELVDSLPGWTAQGGLKMERGFGDVYNANWGNAEIVMELDGNQNYKMSQSVQLKPGHYVLGFRWARRSGSTKTSAMDILWNDKKIFSVAADDKDDSVHHQNILILVRQPKKTHKLSIVGAAASDGLGMTVARFWLDRRKQSFCNHQKNPAEKNFIVNGDLKTTPLTNPGGWQLVPSLPGWTSEGGSLQRGKGRVYNAKWEEDTLVMELDGNSNYAVRQTIYLTPGNYILNFRWARRSGATATSGMSITWDGKKIFSVPGDPKDDSIHQQKIQVSVTSYGTYALRVFGQGSSDGYGMQVTNFKLICNLEQLQGKSGDSQKSSESQSESNKAVTHIERLN